MSGDGAPTSAPSTSDFGGRVPRASAIKMMETVKAIAPGHRAAAAAARPTAAAGAAGGETAQAKRKQAPAPTLSAAPPDPPVKKRRPHGAAEVGVLEWLEAEAEKRAVDNSNAALPHGVEPPQRPHSAALMFMHKIKSRIKQPPGAAWTPKQLAQGVTRLYEALPPVHQQPYRNKAKEALDAYRAEVARLRPAGSKPLESMNTNQRAPSAFAYKMYERNVLPRLRHAHPAKTEEDLIQLCKKEFAGISEKEKRTYQFLAERDRERLRTQELLWREASLGTARSDGSKDRTFHTLVPQFCAFCGKPLLTYMEPKKHCKSCGRGFSLEVVAFSVNSADDDTADLEILEV